MKKISFTLMEVLIAMAIIGIIAGATANSIKNISANRSKLEFRNAYTHMTRTLDDIYSDSTIFPFGVTMCMTNPEEFVEAFKDRTAGAAVKKLYSSGYAFSTKQGSYWVVRRNPNLNVCYVNDVIDIDKADFWIVFDVNGLEKGPNCPYSGEDLGTNGGLMGACSGAPDTFKFGLTVSGKILPDTKINYDIISSFSTGVTHSRKVNLKDYIEENNLLKDNF